MWTRLCNIDDVTIVISLAVVFGSVMGAMATFVSPSSIVRIVVRAAQVFRVGYMIGSGSGSGACTSEESPRRPFLTPSLPGTSKPA